jgi:magnesium transporter
VISALVYAGQEAVAYDDLTEARQAAGTTWVHVAEASDAETQAVQSAFDLHPLVIEDMRGDVRAKTEEFREYTFVLLKAISLTPGETTFEKEVAARPVGIFIGRDWVVTLSTGPSGPIQRVMDAATSACSNGGRTLPPVEPLMSSSTPIFTYSTR